jgi:YD repeat-containing protein
MKKVITIVFLLFSISVFAQQDVTLKNIMPPSPEASAFAKYGTYPAGTYTGRPDISIPMYEIKTGMLSVPISLSYDATGIRVNEMATWAGMNWSLNAGGMVSQMVIGEPDRMSTAFYGVPPRASEIVNNSTYFPYLQSLVDHNAIDPDADPDKFFYSLPNGKSGSFVLDRNRNIMQIPRTSLKISIIGSLSGFRITDESGTVYIFSVYENTQTYIYSRAGQYPNATSNPGGASYKNYTTAYYLSEIISHDGNDHIYFTYENDITKTKDDQYTETWGEKYNNGNQTATTNYNEHRWTGVERSITTPRLKTITYTNGKVEFTRASGRLDDGGVSSRLNEISIYQKTSLGGYIKLKSFKFFHGYYYSSDSYAQNSGLPNQTCDRYRLRLDSLQLKDAVGNVVSKYAFSYNGTNLPPKTSCAQDWWGYYNGKYTNTTLVPTVTVPYAFNMGTTTIGGADRSSNEAYMKAGILEKITYPTGGSTVFEMESHKVFSETSTASEWYSAGAPGQNSNNVVVQTFTVPTNIEHNGTGRLIIQISPYGNIDPPFVKIKHIATGQEQIIYSTDQTQWFQTTLPYSFQGGQSYELTASSNVTLPIGTTTIYANYNTTISDPHLDAVGGLRVKSIKNYGADNALLNEEHYQYGSNGAGSFAGLSPTFNSYSRPQEVYYLVNGNQCNIIAGDPYAVFMGGSLYDQTLVQGSPVVYGSVTKYYGSPNSNAGKTTYYHASAQTETRPLPPGNYLASNQSMLIIYNNWKGGQLLKQEEYRRNSDGSYSLLQEIENSYNTIYTDTTYGLMAQLKHDRVIQPGGELCAAPQFWEYAFAEYPLYTGYVQLAQTKQKDYSSGSSDIAQIVTNHSYDNTRRDIETITTTTNSKGQTIQSEKKFPFHKTQLLTSLTTNESLALDSMVTKNILAPVEEIQRNGSTQMMLKKTSYEYVNATTIAPVNIRYQNKSNPIETRIQFTKYDASGNLVEQSKVDDVSKTYIWGYNKMYPVAEVIGASHAAVMAILDQSVLDNPSDDAAMRTELNKIRTSFSAAQVVTYTYTPHVGVTSQTDVLNRTTYFYYDPFGRLILIKDKDGNIVKKLCYNYLGQTTNCSLYGNVVKTGTYTKTGCTSGNGSPVTYTVPQNTYYATTQADADALAQNDVTANGQAYANANGTCSAAYTQVTGYSYIPSPTYTVSFTNTSTNVTYTMTLYGQSNGSVTIPNGNYNVSFAPGGTPSYRYFSVNSYSTYDYAPTFYNVSINGYGYVEIDY